MSAMKTILNALLSVFFIFSLGCNDTRKYLKDLESENVMARNDAIFHLGEQKEKRAVSMLIKLLESHQSKRIRLGALGALGKIGAGNSVDTIAVLLGEKDKEMRIAACGALGKIKNPDAAGALIKVLDDRNVRLTAIWALGNIGGQEAVPALTKLLDNDDKYVRYNASQSLKKIRNR